MNNAYSNNKKIKIVTISSWTLMIGSTLVLLKFIFMLKGYLSIFNQYQMTKNFVPSVEYNFTNILIFTILEFFLCIIVFVSASFVLKFKESWRRILIYSLLASIFVFFFSPKVMVNAFWWSTIISIFLFTIIIFLSSKEIKVLFE